MAFTKETGIRDYYETYREIEIRKGRKPLPYNIYAKLLKDINKRIRDKILYEAATITLPYRLGTLSVRKFEVAYNPDNIKSWKIDFKASKEAGRVIYYGDKYGYKWDWNKQNAIFKGKRWHNFKPCRQASRLIADAVKNKKLDFYKYKHVKRLHKCKGGNSQDISGS